MWVLGVGTYTDNKLAGNCTYLRVNLTVRDGSYPIGMKTAESAGEKKKLSIP